MATKTSVTGMKDRVGGKENSDFSLIRHSDIVLPKRPTEDDCSLEFFNPRPLDEVLVPEKINKLVQSIRLDGLIENPVVNQVSGDGKKSSIVIELLAGERRYHAIKRIIDGKLPCVDDKGKKPETFKKGEIVNWTNRFGEVLSHQNDVVSVRFDDEFGQEDCDCKYADIMPTKPGNVIHEFVRCKVYYDLPNDRKMRISFAENDNSEPLSTKAEIALIERYLKAGKKQKEIAYLLNTNITFVSQRASFRQELPPEAFEKLIGGKMVAHLAVNMLSFDKEHRKQYFQKMEEIEKFATANAVRKHQAEQEQFEDEAESHERNAKKAEKNGDVTTAVKERKRANAAKGKANKAKSRKERAEAESGRIQQGHAQKAAAELGITPKTAKILAKDQIEELYVKKMSKYVGGGEVDSVTGNVVPENYAAIVRRTAKAIIDGVLDPLMIIREYMIESSEWDIPGETTSGKKSAQKLELDEIDDLSSDVDGDDEDSSYCVNDDDENYEDSEEGWGFNSDMHDREWN